LDAAISVWSTICFWAEQMPKRPDARLANQLPENSIFISTGIMIEKFRSDILPKESDSLVPACQIHFTTDPQRYLA